MLRVIRRRSEGMHERGIHKLVSLISCLILFPLLNDAAATFSFRLTHMALLSFAYMPRCLAASVLEALPLFGQLCTTCVAASASVLSWQPAPGVSSGQAVNEAVHLPSFISIAVCFQLSLQPFVLGALIHGELEDCLWTVFDLPKHLGYSLLSCAQTFLEWVRENGFAFYRRQLPEVPTEDNVDTSEEVLLATSLRIHVSAACSAQIAVQQIQDRERRGACFVDHQPTHSLYFQEERIHVAFCTLPKLLLLCFGRVHWYR